MSNQKQRMIVDIGMVVLLPLLMAYSLIGELFHEIIGTLMMVLIVIHVVYNRRWIAAIPKGRYTPRRIFQTVLDLLLMVFMIMQPLSGILISKHLYTFIQIPGTSTLMRQIHMVLAYWGFILMSVHAGTHLMPMVKKIQGKAVTVRSAVFVAVAAICGYGVYVFIKRRIPEYLFLRSMFVFFDYGESRIGFLVDYLAIMVLFAVLGFIITVLLNANGKGSK